MTAKSAQELIGQKATKICDGITVNVKITDAKNSYGRDRVLITPVSGSGETWVDVTSIKIVTK